MTEINFPISCAEVYWYIADFDSVNSTDIAQKTGLGKSTVQRHLRALEKSNAIEGQGRPKQYRVSDDIPSKTLEWLRKFEELARMTRGLRGKRLLPLGQVWIEGLMLEVNEPLQLISATTVLKEIAQVSLGVVDNAPLGEDYKGFLLLPALSEHGWRCDFSMPDGSFRQGSASHSFPDNALVWAREMIDTGRVNSTQTQLRQFTDEPLVVRPFLSQLDSAFGQYFSQSGARRSWLLAAYLMLQFGNQGQTSFWDDFLAHTVRIKPRQLTKHLNELSKLGILRYFRPPNRNCPTSYYLGPAWLSVKGVSLTKAELEAIEDGEMNIEDGNAIVRVPVNPHYS